MRIMAILPNGLNYLSQPFYANICIVGHILKQTKIKFIFIFFLIHFQKSYYILFGDRPTETRSTEKVSVIITSWLANPVRISVLLQVSLTQSFERQNDVLNRPWCFTSFQVPSTYVQIWIVYRGTRPQWLTTDMRLLRNRITNLWFWKDKLCYSVHSAE
jgi:hypothetical protein